MAKTHIQRWAPQDWRTSRVRARSAMTGDHMLRLVYFEALNALFEHGGVLSAEPELLADELMLPPDEIARCLPILDRLARLWPGNGGLLVEDGKITNPRVSRDLASELEFRRGQAEVGARGGKKAGKGRPAENEGHKPDDDTKEDTPDRGSPNEHRATPEHRKQTPNPPAPYPAPSPSPAPLPETDTALFLSRSDKGVPNNQRVEYAEAVREAFAKRAGNSTYQLGSHDYVVLKSWMDEGIRLAVVLKGITETRGTGRKLAYYNSSVVTEHERVRLARGGTR